MDIHGEVKNWEYNSKQFMVFGYILALHMHILAVYHAKTIKMSQPSMKEILLYQKTDTTIEIQNVTPTLQLID